MQPPFHQALVAYANSRGVRKVEVVRALIVEPLAGFTYLLAGWLCMCVDVWTKHSCDTHPLLHALI